ncbi:MAG: pyridoxal-phosphate dependent enzyme [Nitrospinae bacterium]|nr:pyridoxal-phosphate dependent enzyme [Nitrospinota bacterium]
MDKYTLICCADGNPVNTAGPFDFTGNCHPNSLIKPLYRKPTLNVDADRPGLWKYIDWLPVRNQNSYVYGPVTYKSKGLARELGLENLWISFSGYYPDLRAYYKTCTFKELHAVVAIQYARENGIEKLVMASAGNTAVAFVYIAEMLKFPVVCVVPEKCMCGVNIPNMLIEHSRIVMLEGGDYSDALDITKRLAAIKGYTYEGGSRNFAVARQRVVPARRRAWPPPYPASLGAECPHGTHGQRMERRTRPDRPGEGPAADQQHPRRGGRPRTVHQISCLWRARRGVRRAQGHRRTDVRHHQRRGVRVRRIVQARRGAGYSARRRRGAVRPADGGAPQGRPPLRRHHA